MNKYKYIVFRSLWFWWFLTTAIYLIFNTQGYPPQEGASSMLGYVAGFVGLFVPFGFMSLILFFVNALTWVGLAAFIGLMLSAEKILMGRNLGLGEKIFFNLLALLIITIIVDLIRGTAFQSFIIFSKGAFPHYCC